MCHLLFPELERLRFFASMLRQLRSAIYAGKEKMGDAVPCFTLKLDELRTGLYPAHVRGERLNRVAAPRVRIGGLPLQRAAEHLLAANSAAPRRSLPAIVGILSSPPSAPRPPPGQPGPAPRSSDAGMSPRRAAASGRRWSTRGNAAGTTWRRTGRGAMAER